MQLVIKLLWSILAVASFVGGLAGILLPIIPGIPFLILTLVCIGKISRRFDRWLAHTTAYHWLDQHQPRLAHWLIH